MPTVMAMDRTVRQLVRALKSVQAPSPGARSLGVLHHSLVNFFADAAGVVEECSPWECKQLRDRALDDLLPLVRDAGLLRAVHRRTEAGVRNFDALRRVQENNPCGGSAAAEAFDRFLLGCTPLAALRARRLFFRRELRHRLQRATARHPLRLLAFGAGPAGELLQVLNERGSGPIPLRAVLLDGDRDCLSNIAAYAAAHGFSDAVETCCLDPVRACLLRDTRGLDGQDLVYAPGMFDFLPDKLACRSIEFAVRLLVPGGQLILAHYHGDLTAVDRVVLEWWLDWWPYFRSPQMIASLLKTTTPGRLWRTALLVRGPNIYSILQRPSNR